MFLCKEKEDIKKVTESSSPASFFVLNWITDQFIVLNIRYTTENERGGIAMKGYAISEGYMGFVDGEYMLFACESEYREYLED